MARIEATLEEPLRMRLYPRSRRGLYIAVNVWPSASAMRAYARRTGDAKSARRNCHGYCACYTVRRFSARQRGRLDPMFAEVNLYRQRLTMEIVTHELSHAAIAWARRIGFDFARLAAQDSINSDEEVLAYAIGRLCASFVRRAIALKLYATSKR